MDENENLVEDDSKYDRLPGRAILQLRIPMLCPDCDDIHFIPVTASAVPIEGGVQQLILDVQNRLVKGGFRYPTDADMQRWSEQQEAAVKAMEEMEKAQEEAKARGATYIHREGREGGDA